MAGAIGSVVGGIAGGIAAGGSRNNANTDVNNAIGAVNGVQVPADLANAIYNQQYTSSGQMSPALQQNINAANSLAAQVKANPQLQAAQMQALQSLGQLSNTGMSSADRARLNQIQQQSAAQAEGQRQSVLQNFAQRGIGGSGNELLAQLQASQNAANQANQGGLQVAANAQSNALNALGQYGGQAGQMNSQQYGQQQQAAQAQDQLNRFNTQNQLGVQAANVGAQNQAQMYNLQNSQNLNNMNTQTQNQEYLRQKAAEQQQFSDAMSKATGQANADFMGAGYNNMLGNQTAAQYSNIGSGLGNIAGGAMSSGQSQDEKDLASENGMAEGGEVKEDCYADGGNVSAQNFNPALNHSSGSMPMIAMLAGGRVPGKAPFKGNNYANDIVKAHLSPGEFVVPKSVMESEDPGDNAKKMIELHMALNKAKK